MTSQHLRRDQILTAESLYVLCLEPLEHSPAAFL
jgi:hypothetical protein